MKKQLTSRSTILLLTIAFLAMAVLPQWIHAQTSKGIELCKSWKFGEAEKVLRQALKANPRDTQASYHLGLSLLMQDKHEEALKILSKLSDEKKVQASDSEQYPIQIALARTRLELKQNSEALKNLEAAKKIRSNGVEVFVYRGAYYLNLREPEKAITELKKAIQLDKNDPYAHFYLGYAYLQTGNPEFTVDELKTFLELAPYAPEAAKAKALVEALC
jgi:tetratricopeptide (TPR) repeat protein